MHHVCWFGPLGGGLLPALRLAFGLGILQNFRALSGKLTERILDLDLVNEMARFHPTDSTVRFTLTFNYSYGQDLFADQ